MGAKVGSSKGGPMAEINVTPLVDVVLVLLIIFMVVTPMLASGIDVKLPASKTTQTVNDVGQNLVISIRADGAIFVDTKETTLDTLVADMMAEVRKNPGRTLLVKAAETLTYKQVRDVADLIAENGTTILLLACEKSKDKVEKAAE